MLIAHGIFGVYDVAQVIGNRDENRLHMSCMLHERRTNVPVLSNLISSKDIYDILLLLSTYNKYKHSIIRSKTINNTLQQKSMS